MFDNKKCNGLIENIKKLVRSVEALPEDLEDFSIPMVIIGCDVEALYPSLDIDRVVKMVHEAIKRSTVKWQDIDFMEGT